jgi:hypothetical protein
MRTSLCQVRAEQKCAEPSKFVIKKRQQQPQTPNKLKNEYKNVFHRHKQILSNAKVGLFSQ